MPKKCLKCGEEKQIAEFKKHKCRKDGLSDWCRACFSKHRKQPELVAQARETARSWRARNPSKVKEQAKRARIKYPDKYRKFFLKDEYGITVEQYNEMFKQQDGKCAICETHQSVLSRRLSVDHDHETGKVRSLLCNFCNTAIGSFKDKPELLSRAIEYLNAHQ